MDAVQIVQEQVDAFNARDVERFVSCYCPDAAILSGDDTVIAQGHDGIRAVYGQLFADSPALHAAIPTRIHVGAWVVDEEQLTGFVFAGLPSEMHAAVLYHIDGGKIAKSVALF